MGCGSSTPAFDMDPKDTIMKVLQGKFSPEMLDSVLTSENVDTPLNDDTLGDEVTPLLMATNIGNMPALKAILAMNPNLAATDDKGNTALHIAVAKGQIEAVEDLIKAGSDVNLGNSEGTPPLRTAILENENTDILEQLLEGGAKTDFTTPELPLVTAATKANLGAVEVLLQHGADHKDMMVPLASGQLVDIYTWATKEGNSRIVGLLALEPGEGEVSGLPNIPNEDAEEAEEAEPADGGPNTVTSDNDLLKEGEDKDEREGGDGEEEPPAGEGGVEPDNRSSGDGDVQTAEEPAAESPAADDEPAAADNDATTKKDVTTV